MEPSDGMTLNASGRRSGQDRRRRQTSPFSMASLRGSRKGTRREEDRGIHYYVDLYGHTEGLLFLCILLLSVADAFLTLTLIDRGMSEYNMVMDYFLRLGPLSFVLVKYFLTAAGLICLLLHKNYPLFRGRLGVSTVLVGIVVMYCTLIAYELALLSLSG